ncbi:hypothetical protein [Streptomyces anulatus]|uniref:DUF6197 family protein n=1 Tax=Streptomyces anulatus TaxID=1892 RepID=UPI002F9096A1|nr:hypothetical protein OHA54_39185 [Streptomyces anulatus]WTD30710.1 hypothetical protein OH737_39795 [Streptomyces anulatus]WTE08648.1 hypothetical protein OH765_39550 [Streptomyces anulatus]
MPQTLTAAASSVVITTPMLEKAAQLARDAYRPLWTGNSGEQSTGEAVARHLDATITLLDTDGWTRTWSWPTPPDSTLPATDDETSVRDMVRTLLDYVREEDSATVRTSQRTVTTALGYIGGTEHGDPDTRDIAQDVLNVLVQALTDNTDARFTAWSERLTRTHADITALLAAGARFARTYGPGAPASEPTTA